MIENQRTAGCQQAFRIQFQEVEAPARGGHHQVAQKLHLCRRSRQLRGADRPLVQAQGVVDFSSAARLVTLPKAFTAEPVIEIVSPYGASYGMVTSAE